MVLAVITNNIDSGVVHVVVEAHVVIQVVITQSVVAVQGGALDWLAHTRLRYHA